MENQTVFDSLYRLIRQLRRYEGQDRPRSSREQRRGGHRRDRDRSSFSEGRLMHLLLANDGMSARELAEQIDIRPPSLTPILERLELRGEIVRIRDEKDSRVWRISLTDEGRQQIKRRAAFGGSQLAEVENCLTEEERKTFIALCEKLGNRLIELAEPDSEGGEQ